MGLSILVRLLSLSYCKIILCIVWLIFMGRHSCRSTIKSAYRTFVRFKPSHSNLELYNQIRLYVSQIISEHNIHDPIKLFEEAS